MNFKDHGMGRDRMLKNLQTLRAESDSETENILLNLMDFVVGWCNPSLAIFDETGNKSYIETR